MLKVSLSAFGRELSLSLSRNENLVPRHRPLTMFMAEKDQDDISLIEDDIKQVRMTTLVWLQTIFTKYDLSISKGKTSSRWQIPQKENVYSAAMSEKRH